MKTRYKITFIASVIVITMLTVILNTEILGDDATFGECIISTSEQRSSVSSGSSMIENQCKEECVLNALLGKNEDRDVFCKFHTLSGYGWSKAPEEFEEIMDKASLNPLW
jgi:hypothetical protein